MFLAHSIRLRDPWQCDCTPAGGIRWSRVFHRPSGLEDDDALWLVVAGLPAEAALALNGQSVPRAADRNEFDVTSLIAEINRIEIDVPSALQPPAASLQADAPFPFDVRLGIVGHS